MTKKELDDTIWGPETDIRYTREELLEGATAEQIDAYVEEHGDLPFKRDSSKAMGHVITNLGQKYLEMKSLICKGEIK